MEKWDLYTKDDKKTGKIVDKGALIPEGYYHIIDETLIKHTDGTYLVMQRSYDKKEYPGKYEGSCGGSIKAGETKEEGAIREVFEESGLVINEVTPTYYFIQKDVPAINQGYLAIISAKDKTIKYQKEETINHKWLTLKELKAFIKSDEYNESHASRLVTYLDSLNE